MVRDIGRLSKILHFQHYQDYLETKFFFCNRNHRQSTSELVLRYLDNVKMIKIRHANGHINCMNQNKKNTSFVQKKTHDNIV